MKCAIHIISILVCTQLPTAHLMFVPMRSSTLSFPYNLQIPLDIDIKVDSNIAEQCILSKEYCYEVVSGNCIQPQCLTNTCRYSKIKPLKPVRRIFTTNFAEICGISLFDASITFNEPTADLDCTETQLPTINLDPDNFAAHGGYTLSFTLNLEWNSDLSIAR